MMPDLDTVSGIIRTVAAEEILPRYRTLSAGDIREKSGPGDLVTVADESAERALSRLLPDLLPGSIVIGEEATAADPRRLDLIAGDAPVWIIDPVDGTSNFVAGKPLFAVIVALVVDGVTVAGWIYDPCADSMLVGERGGGAWMDGDRQTVAAPAAPASMRGTIGARFFAPDIRQRLKQRRGLLGQAYSLACAGQEYRRVVSGQTHFSAYCRLMPWDHAAGALLHAEAGGYSACLDGTPYRPSLREGGMLTAPDRDSWEALNRVLFLP